MKKMKMILMTAILGVATLSTVFTSCVTDNCADVVCENGGVCDDTDGSCACPLGYEGATCETMSKTKFLKNWNASDLEDGTTTPLVYTCLIADGSSITDVIVAANFSDGFFTNTISATVNENTITIPNQQPDSDGYAVAGSGVYNDVTNTIDWTYSITDPTNAILTYDADWN